MAVLRRSRLFFSFFVWRLDRSSALKTCCVVEIAGSYWMGGNWVFKILFGVGLETPSSNQLARDGTLVSLVIPDGMEWGEIRSGQLR